MTTPRRHDDATIYAASVRYGREGAAHVLGVSASWIGKRSRKYALANAVPVPMHASSHPPKTEKPSRVNGSSVSAQSPWSHRRLADGGLRVREQVRQNRTWPPA